MKMDISEIKDLINAISNSKIDIFDYEENGAKLHLEKKTEVVIVNYIEKMLGERREKIIESDEYIRQDIEDLKELEERYASMKIPYMFRRVIDDYIACMESKSERYADLSYIKGMGDAISLLKNIGALNSQETLSMNVK